MPSPELHLSLGPKGPMVKVYAHFLWLLLPSHGVLHGDAPAARGKHFQTSYDMFDRI